MIFLENMFAKTKHVMKDYMFIRKEETSLKISELMFGFDKITIESFIRKTLNNMILFWENLEREKIIGQLN